MSDTEEVAPVEEVAEVSEMSVLDALKEVRFFFKKNFCLVYSIVRLPFVIFVFVFSQVLYLFVFPF